MLEDLTDFSGRRSGENGPTERENAVEYRRQGLGRSPQEPTPAPVNTREQEKKYQPENWLVFLSGGGEGNRTPVRKYSTASSTYLARLFDLAECTPTGRLARSELP